MVLSERFVMAVSDDELERRWRATREAMADAGLDVLVAENNNNSVGGYVQWLTGVPATNGVPLTVVFPRDDEMTVINHGPRDARRELSESDGVWRGVKAIRSTAFFAAVDYTSKSQSALVAEALAPFATATIGLLTPFQMLYSTVADVASALPSARLVDAADSIDPVKVPKSAEEIEMIRRAAAIQDAAFEAALAAIEPGRTDREVAAVAQARSVELGSDQGFVLCGSSPLGTPAHFGPSHLQGRVIKEGDVIALLVENSGPGGMWSELGRSVVLGKAPERLLEAFDFAFAAQSFTLERLRPGASAAQVHAEYQEHLRQHGRPPERRIHCHGQGYDLVERPLIRDDETMALPDGLNVACHPGFDTEDAFCTVCDGFIITAAGAERLHKTEQKLFEL